MTDCREQRWLFQDLGSRKVEVDFGGGYLSSDGGGLILRELERHSGLLRDFAGCFVDYRDSRYIEHSVEELVSQRIHGLVLGYEDLNDHDHLRRDPIHGLIAGKSDPLGQDRILERDKGKALAAQSTLNRLELSAEAVDARYHKVQAQPDKVQELLIKRGVKAIPRRSAEIVLDLDATDDPLHGRQEGAYFNGYYRHYCYLPLYCFCGNIPLLAQLRDCKRDASDGTLEALQKIVPAIRRRFGSKVRIIVRADSGFCREEIMAWCEEEQPVVYYCLGLARNSRLRELIDEKFARVRESAILCGGVARGFTEFQYQTLKSWTCSRRVIAKVEVLQDKDNPRFIVTNLPAKDFEDQQQQSPDRFCAQKCYEDFYCARGDMENQIKQQYLDLEADRTSSHWMASNQLRLWFSAFALLLFQRLRTLALRGTELANATAGTIRQRFLKIGALVTVSTRRVYVRLASAFPLQKLFAQAHRALAVLALEEG